MNSSKKVTPEEILAFPASEEAQRRAEELTERNKTGSLTSEEAVELEQMRQFNRLVSLLKAKARCYKVKTSNDYHNC